MNHTPVYLIMITANNNNKYYRMIPHGDTFEVEYGRVGGSCQRVTYPIRQWDKKYNEKINKGYVDHTELMLDLIHKDEPKNNQYREIENISIARIVSRLQEMASKTIQSNYRVDSMAVTQAMVEKAQQQIDMMANAYKNMTVEKFNESLITLFGIIPRKMNDVSSYLSDDTNDFGVILSREQDLLDVMKGQVVQHAVTSENPTEVNDLTQTTILEAMGLVIEEVNDQEVEHIKELMGISAHRFKSAWKVINLKTQKAFDEYIAAENITNIKELWHGSKNPNWWSIINSGLEIRPASGAANGSMLGRALYFANDIEKSVSYTDRSSYSYSHQPTGFCGIMKVAYGKPYNIYAFDPKYYSMNFDKLQQLCPGANCLHAHAGMNTGWGSLRRDEITVYKACQQTIEYLVEFV